MNAKDIFQRNRQIRGDLPHTRSWHACRFTRSRLRPTGRGKGITLFASRSRCTATLAGLRTLIQTRQPGSIRRLLECE